MLCTFSELESRLNGKAASVTPLRKERLGSRGRLLTVYIEYFRAISAPLTPREPHANRGHDLIQLKIIRFGAEFLEYSLYRTKKI